MIEQRIIKTILKFKFKYTPYFKKMLQTTLKLQDTSNLFVINDNNKFSIKVINCGYGNALDLTINDKIFENIKWMTDKNQINICLFNLWYVLYHIPINSLVNLSYYSDKTIKLIIKKNELGYSVNKKYKRAHIRAILRTLGSDIAFRSYNIHTILNRYYVTIEMKAKEFVKLCDRFNVTDSYNSTKVFRISCNQNYVDFFCQNNFGSINIVYNNGTYTKITLLDKVMLPINNKYKITNLLKYKHVYQSYADIKIYMGNDMALILELNNDISKLFIGIKHQL